MPDNIALWLPAKGRPFAVAPAQSDSPGPNQIRVRSRAVALNPADRLTQTMGDIIMPYLHYPVVVGSDVAGEVVAVGENVTRFRIGDRVLGHAAGLDKARNCPAEGAFRTEVLLLEHMSSPIPPTLSYEDACVLPLALSTAACALFQDDYLALGLPALDAPRKSEVVVVWGGSTSVGCNAIQLAAAAGYEVVATASPHNFELLRSLGARAVFDRRSAAAVDEIVDAVQDRHLAGAVAIGAGSGRPCVDVAGRCRGARFVAMASTSVSFEGLQAGPGRWRRLLPLVARMFAGNAHLALQARRRGVRTKFIWGSSLLGNDVGPMIYERFLPSALAKGAYRIAPTPVIAGQGFDAIVPALDRLHEGASARKLVVTL